MTDGRTLAQGQEPEPRSRLGAARWLGLFLPPLAYMGLIFYFSSKSQPLPFLPPAIFSQDKLLHALAYALLGGLLQRAFSGLGLSRGRALWLAVSVASLYGVTDEWHQSFVPGRSCDPFDWLADTLGALAGAALTAVLLRPRKPRASIEA